MAVVISVVSKALLSLGMKLLSEKLLEQLIVYSLGKLAESTKTSIDDEIYKLVKGHLEAKKK